MKLVVLESPFASDNARDRNLYVAYAKRAVHDCLLRKEAPIASHLLFTQEDILDDNDPTERALGIAAGLAWHRVCDLVVFYCDYGWSSGMKDAKAKAEEFGVPYEIRYLDGSSK